MSLVGNNQCLSEGLVRRDITLLYTQKDFSNLTTIRWIAFLLRDVNMIYNLIYAQKHVVYEYSRQALKDDNSRCPPQCP